MKRQVTKLVILSLFLSVFTMALNAQEAEKKKQVQEQKVITEEMLKKAEEANVHAQEAYRRAVGVSVGRDFRDVERDTWVDFSNNGENFLITSPQFEYFGSQNSSSIEYTKSVKEANFSKEFTADIDSDAHKVSIYVSGSCKSGEIRIKINMPSGKSYTEVLIDEYGSVNWTKTFTIDEEGDDKVGTWKFLISGKDATGNFRVSVKSN